jgi:hypothetical protein
MEISRRPGRKTTVMGAVTCKNFPPTSLSLLTALRMPFETVSSKLSGLPKRKKSLSFETALNNLSLALKVQSFGELPGGEMDAFVRGSQPSGWPHSWQR